MARAAVRLGVRQLAQAAGISFTTANRFETGKSGLQHSSAEALRRGLEGRGVQFLNAGSAADGPGIALRPGASDLSD